MNFVDPNERFVAQAFTETLQASGWINSTAEEIALKCGATADFVEKVLKILQEFEPAGLFARNLRECLLLQAADKGCLTDQFTILLDNLTLLAKGQFESLQRKLKCSKETLMQHIKTLRSFNPKPGERFDQGFQQITAPDLMVKKSNDGWTVDLNRSNLPTVYINSEYAKDIQRNHLRWRAQERVPDGKDRFSAQS